MNASQSDRVFSTSAVQTLVAALFRRKKVIITSCAVVFCVTAITIAILPNDYVAEMKILVERERIDPVITASDNSHAAQLQQARVTQQDVNSEVDLLQSPGLLRAVVLATHLNEPQGRLAPVRRRLFGRPDDEAAIASAILSVQKHLSVDPPNQSNLITVRFTSSSPELSRKVLAELSHAYTQWHVQVHRPSRTAEFFGQQVVHYNAILQGINQQLADFSTSAGTVAADQEKANAVQRISDLDGELTAARIALRETQETIRALRTLEASTPARRTTQVKTSAVLLEQIKGSLYTLLQKRTELLQHYEPTYRAVQEVDAQIADLRQRIADVNNSPTVETTTADDPTHELVRQELAKAEAETAALRGRSAALEHSIQTYRARAEQLQRQSMAQLALIRNAKNAESNYLLYMQKVEEARISDALDRNRFTNVTIAEAPVSFGVPTTSTGAKLLMGFLFALAIGLFVGVAVDYLDPAFRTAEEVEALLNIPVLASIPAQPTNGGTGGNGSAWRTSGRSLSIR